MNASFATAVLVAALSLSQPAWAQQVTKPDVAGVTNFARLETTIACGGATKAEALPAIKKMGFVAVINLRQATEDGANIPEAQATAKEVGLNYVHIPFNGQKPDPAVADKFIEAITAPGNTPAYVHCAGGSRAASMWMIKRLVVDKWDAERAGAEATALGLTSAPLKQFALDYAASHKK